MLDIKYIRENPNEVIERLAVKGRDAKEEIAKIIELDAQRRAMIAENESLKAEQNKVNKLIPQYKKEGKDVAPIFAEMKELGNKAKANDEKIKEVEDKYNELMYVLPNLPDRDLKAGGKENTKEVNFKK